VTSCGHGSAEDQGGLGRRRLVRCGPRQTAPVDPTAHITRPLDPFFVDCDLVRPSASTTGPTTGTQRLEVPVPGLAGVEVALAFRRTRRSVDAIRRGRSKIRLNALTTTTPTVEVTADLATRKAAPLFRRRQERVDLTTARATSHEQVTPGRRIGFGLLAADNGKSPSTIAGFDEGTSQRRSRIPTADQGRRAGGA